MTKRQQSLLNWLDFLERTAPFENEWALTQTAARAMAANEEEQKWLVQQWDERRAEQLDFTDSAASIASTTTDRAGAADQPVNQEDTIMAHPDTGTVASADTLAGAGPTPRLPAVRSVAPELDGLARVGKWLAAAEKRNPDENDRGAAAALRLYVARELGMSPLMGLKIGITPDGRLILPAALYRDLATARGYRVVRVESTDESCTAVLIKLDTGEEVGRQTYTIDRAKKAGLVKGTNWQNYPDRMLWHRASKWVVEDFVPGLSFAISEDEAEEIANEPVLDLEPEYDEIPVE